MSLLGSKSRHCKVDLSRMMRLNSSSLRVERRTNKCGPGGKGGPTNQYEFILHYLRLDSTTQIAVKSSRFNRSSTIGFFGAL